MHSVIFTIARVYCVIIFFFVHLFFVHCIFLYCIIFFFSFVWLMENKKWKNGKFSPICSVARPLNSENDMNFKTLSVLLLSPK